MIEVLKRLEKLEQKQNKFPVAIVTFADGHTQRLDITQIARLFFDCPETVMGLRWISGNYSGIICQLLECEDYWKREVSENDKD